MVTDVEPEETSQNLISNQNFSPPTTPSIANSTGVNMSTHTITDPAPDNHKSMNDTFGKSMFASAQTHHCNRIPGYQSVVANQYSSKENQHNQPPPTNCTNFTPTNSMTQTNMNMAQSTHNENNFMPAFQPQSSTNNVQHRLLEHQHENNETHSVYEEQQENKGLMQHDQFNQNQGFNNSID